MKFLTEIVLLVASGLTVRLSLMLFGHWQDTTMAVKFTDIDYRVVTDAAQYMTQGKSPYLRDTYRYTPLLAWILQLNIVWTEICGKLVFVGFDLMTGYIIYQIVKQKSPTGSMAKLCASAWLLNPLPMTVSTRGNAESIMSFLVLLCLLLLRTNRLTLAGFVYGLAVHVKIYPVTYALPLYFYLGTSETQKNANRQYLNLIVSFFKPTKERLKFISAALVTLGLLTSYFYFRYGWDFLHHTYLYHITRKDIRHNFSVYFYMLYLHATNDQSFWFSLFAFIPQAVLLIIFSLTFYKDLELVFFLNTFAFVTFNKVCTSQYFLWYLCLLPLLVPKLTRLSITKALWVTCVWFAGQGLWLLPAYYLEFEGKNTFLYIWAAGIVFFFINCYVLCVIIDNYEDMEVAKRKPGTSDKLEPLSGGKQSPISPVVTQRMTRSQTRNRKQQK